MALPRNQAVHCGLRLDANEATLWQGAPSCAALVKHVFHVRPVGAYFAGLEVLGLISFLRGHAPFVALVLPVLLAAAVIGLLYFLSFGIARSTTYVVTDRRVIFRFGVALPRSLSIPFRQIVSLSVSQDSRQCGDVVLVLRRENHMPYLKLWPHAKPWSIRAPKPTLRAIAAAGAVATILARELSRAEQDRLRTQPEPSAIAA